MNQLNSTISNFEIINKPSDTLLQKYKDKLPTSVFKIWTSCGFGSFLDGYLRVVNPDDFDELLKNVWSDYKSDYFVIFTTGMGDLLVKKNEFLYFLNFRHNQIEVVAKDYDIFFNRCLPDEEFLEDEFSWLPYKDAVEKLGKPAYDECFGYEPILAAGGSEKVENLKKVNIKEHISIIAQFTRKI